MNNYHNLITSQYRTSEKFKALITSTTNPIIDVTEFLSTLNEKFSIETAQDDCLRILANWVGAPLLIPGGRQVSFFGFSDQENSQTFGELDDEIIGGYFREVGQSGTSGLTPTSDFLRRLITAKILQNSCNGLISETKEIIKLVLDHENFMVIDNKDMTVTFKFNTSYSLIDKTLVEMFFPLPMGISLIFGD